MTEFKSTGKEFGRRTRRRIAWEAIAFVLFSVCLWLGFLNGLPQWMRVTTLVLLVAFILIDMVSYAKWNKTVGTFTLYLRDYELGFSHQSGESGTGQLPYKDLRISEVKKENGKVVEVRLRTVFGQTIKLRDMENMQELYEELAKRITQS